MNRFEDVPRELIIELLKYTNHLGPELFISHRIEKPYHIDEFYYSIGIDVSAGEKYYKFHIYFGHSKEKFEQFILKGTKLQFDDPFCICMIENNMFLVNNYNSKYFFKFPLDRYKEKITSQFERIASELNIKEV